MAKTFVGCQCRVYSIRRDILLQQQLLFPTQCNLHDKYRSHSNHQVTGDQQSISVRHYRRQNERQGKANQGKKKMKLLCNIMIGRDYGQERFDLRQIKMETGQQVKKQVRNLLDTGED